MEKKYEMTNETRQFGPHVFYRIKAVKDFRDVKRGDLGGFIEDESNLSHNGDCWVYDDARVYGDARVCNNAVVSGNARVYDNARVCNNAVVSGDAWVCNNAVVSGDAWVYNNAVVSGDAWVYDDARVYGDAWVYSRARISKKAKIESSVDYITIGPIGSRNDITTFYKAKDDSVYVDCGCFWGSLEHFEEAVHKTHHGTRHEVDYMNAIVLAKAKLSQ